MNIIIANDLKDDLKLLNIPIEKQLIGKYSIDDIITTFSSYDFSTLIIDASAIKDLTNFDALQRLASSIDTSKIIFVFKDVGDTNIISKMIQFGIYNYATNNSKILELISKPNSYKDVAHYHELNTKSNSSSLTNKIGGTRIIGFKNITRGAGSTSLTYMSKKYLEKLYNVFAIEVNREDFEAYKKEDDRYLSVKEDDFVNQLNNITNYDIIFVDINDSNVGVYCTDVYYLIEPSIIQIHKLNSSTKVEDLFRDKKVILNKSFLTSNELATFQAEGRLKVFFNLPCLNDRTNNPIHLVEFYKKIGLNKRHAKKTRKYNHR